MKSTHRVAARGTVERLEAIEDVPFFHFHPGSFAFEARTLVALAEAPVRATRAGALSVVVPLARPHGRVDDAVRRCRNHGIATLGALGLDALSATSVVVPDAILVDVSSLLGASVATLDGALGRIADVIAKGVWVELTLACGPGQNEDDRQMDSAVSATVRRLGRAVPLHVTTPGLGSADRARASHLRWIAMSDGMHWVYSPRDDEETTLSSWCPGCDARIARRRPGLVETTLLTATCPACGTTVPGRFPVGPRVALEGAA